MIIKLILGARQFIAALVKQYVWIAVFPVSAAIEKHIHRFHTCCFAVVVTFPGPSLCARISNEVPFMCAQQERKEKQKIR